MRRLFAVMLLGLALTSDLWAQAPEFESTPVGDGVYQFRFRGHNGLFVLTEEGVVAFDPISAEAAVHYADEIRRIAPGQPLRMIVYSHHHADHASGANVLRAEFEGDIPIVAHDYAFAPIAEAANADQPPPNITFTDQLTLRIGGRTIELHYLGRNHSDNTIVGYLPDDRIAFAVDFVSNDRVGYRDLSSHYFPDFFDSLDQLAELDMNTVVFGHGPRGDQASIDRQVQYYGDLRRAVSRAYDGGLSEDEAAEQVDLPAYADWGGYDDWFALNVRGMYRWIAERGS